MINYEANTRICPSILAAAQEHEKFRPRRGRVGGGSTSSEGHAEDRPHLTDRTPFRAPRKFMKGQLYYVGI